MLLSIPRASIVADIGTTPTVKDAPVAKRLAARAVSSANAAGTVTGARIREYRRARGTGRDQATAGQPLTQLPPSPRQAALERPDRASHLAGRLFIGTALQIAEHDRDPVAVRQPIDLFVEGRPLVTPAPALESVGCQFGHLPFGRLAAPRDDPGADGDAIRDPIEPGPQ